jgi:predicted RNase H-like nuclease (RuvC/YqgF family)
MDPPSENTESHDAPADGGPAKRKRTASPDGGDRNMISPDVMKAVISATGSAVAAAIHSSQMEQQRVVEKADAESAQHAADLIGYNAQLKAKDKEMSDLGVKLTKQCSLSDELKRDTEAKDKEIAGLREEMKRVKEMSGSKDKELAGLQAAEVQLQVGMRV